MDTTTVRCSGSDLRQWHDPSRRATRSGGRRGRRHRRRRTPGRRRDCGRQEQAPQVQEQEAGQTQQRTADPTPPVNVCAGKNWCIDRTQTCGPAGGYGKCLVDASRRQHLRRDPLPGRSPAQNAKRPTAPTAAAYRRRVAAISATTEPAATTSSASARSDEPSGTFSRGRAPFNDPDRSCGQGLSFVWTWRWQRHVGSARGPLPGEISSITAATCYAAGRKSRDSVLHRGHLATPVAELRVRHGTGDNGRGPLRLSHESADHFCLTPAGAARSRRRTRSQLQPHRS